MFNDRPVEANVQPSSGVKEGLGLRESIAIEIFRGHPDGYREKPDEISKPNDLIVNAGRSFLAQRIGSDVTSAMAHMAVGSGSTGAVLGDTVLESEAARKALAVNSAIVDNIYTAIATFGGNADGVTSVPLVEAGVFNHAESGQLSMFQRITFAAVTLANSDIVKVSMQTNVGSNTI